VTAAEAEAREEQWLDAQLADSPEITEEQAQMVKRMFDTATEGTAS
jgi:hypothetical protein